MRLFISAAFLLFLCIMGAIIGQSLKEGRKEETICEITCGKIDGLKLDRARMIQDGVCLCKYYKYEIP